MGLRFKKSIKIFPGVRINLSKSGVSTSIGGRGATINFSKRGTRATVGIPGSGLSYSEHSPASAGFGFWQFVLMLVKWGFGIFFVLVLIGLLFPA